MPEDDDQTMQSTPAALKIPELLENIFSVSDEESNCNANVLVCKAWSEPCMNVIWKEVTDLLRVAKLLGPIAPYHVPAFSNKKEPFNWDRFHFYAKRIRRITCHHDEYKDGYKRKNYEFLFAEIGLSRPSTPLFPNLQALEWHGEIDLYRQNFSVMFMEPTLKQYILHDNSATVPALSLILRTVAERCPGLKSISLTLGSDIAGMDDAVLKFIERMTSVKSLTLPPFQDMAPFASVLRNFSHLEELIIGDVQIYRGLPFIQSLSPPSTGSNCFARLTTFSIVASYLVAGEFFTNSLPSMKRVTITSDIRKAETPTSVKRLIELLAEKCPQLEVLCLSYNPLLQPVKQQCRSPPPSCFVKSMHLQPLLACSRIRSFEFNHPYAVTLEDQFAEDIGSNWPYLQKLSLAPTPCMQRKDFKNCFTLRALLSFACHCRHLYHLAILVAPQPSTCPSQSDIQALPPRFFASLSTFDVGASMIYECDVVHVTMILSRLLPEKCTIQYEKPSKLGDTGESSSDKSKWKLVKHRIPYVRWMEREVGAKICDLEAENRRLRAELNASSA
ncbi:hypothetical protein GYMLUDRAFT_61995 [Collybiopsis luxurians FD-317 M1]|uniref:F-box domain-containing protein n=1 Tax=Collybiopsis luxurians FD-317 M1 TaxID=944289 RepID=A0A0D0CE44_9AGAR|nr:hypothetical protein GYMLUDRAFT_61995 [Collybiopsis luxurians FD-317 M1]